MLLYRNDIDGENVTAHLTRIDGWKMVSDLHYLNGLQKKAKENWSNYATIN